MEEDSDVSRSKHKAEHSDSCTSQAKNRQQQPQEQVDDSPKVFKKVHTQTYKQKHTPHS